MCSFVSSHSTRNLSERCSWYQCNPGVCSDCPASIRRAGSVPPPLSPSSSSYSLPLQKPQTALTSSVFFVFRARIHSWDAPPLSFSIISHARLWLKLIPLNYRPINYTTLRYTLYPFFVTLFTSFQIELFDAEFPSLGPIVRIPVTITKPLEVVTFNRYSNHHSFSVNYRISLIRCPYSTGNPH